MNKSVLRKHDREIVRRYLAGESAGGIARSLCVADNSIDYRLKINGIKKRTISQALRGRVLSPKHRVSLSLSRILSGVSRGERNPRWKGGVQDEWSRLKNSNEYRQWRSTVYARDGYACRMCGDVRGGNLHAHHIYPRRDYPEKKLLVENGITLCIPCHKKTIWKEYEFIALFEKMSNSVKPSSHKLVLSQGSRDMVIPSQAA